MRPLSRRRLLAAASIAGAVTAAGCTPELFKVSRDAEFIPVARRPVRWLGGGYRPLNMNALSDLVIALSEEDKTAARARTEAVIANLCWVQAENGVSGSALLLDERGLYLTCAHLFDARRTRVQGFIPSTSAATVHHIASGEATPISSYVVDGAHDIAIFNAERGQGAGPVAGLTFNVRGAAPGARAVMHAVMERGVDPDEPRFSRAVPRGTVLAGEAPPQPIDGLADRMMIEGMIPFGGSSGSPVLGPEGQIVGVESGFYPTVSSDRKTYRGATVTRIRAIIPLLQRGRVVQLERYG